MGRTVVKPPFAYYGGKTTLADRIVSVLPPHGHYVEPYFGGGSVLLDKPPSHMETVNDLDGDLMCFWRMLRERPDELVRLCALTPHSRAELDAARKPAEDDLEQARRVWVRISQGRTGTLRDTTGWRHYVDPGGSSVGMPGYLAGYVGRMATVAERLSHVSLECRPALELIERYGRSPGVLLYVDPPYLGGTRPRGRNYQCKMTGEAEHRELAAALSDARAAVVLSGYASPLYAELYDGWTRVDIPANTGHATVGDRDRVETLWLNRPLPAPRAQGDMFEMFGVGT